MHTKVLALERAGSSSLSGYGIALLSVTLAAVFTLMLRRLGYPASFALFYGAVLVSAWFGGFFPTLFATGLSASAIIFIFQPFFSLSGLGPYNTGRLVAFVLISVVVCYLSAAHARSEAARRASEQHYRLLFERNLAGVFLSTIDGLILDCNEAFARIVGYDSREEVLTHHASDFYFETAHRKSFLEQLQKEGKLTTLEVCLRGKAAKPVWVLASVNLLNGADGAQVSLQGTIIEIMEHKREEDELRKQKELLQAVFDHAPVMMSFYHEDGHLKMVNREWERTRGWSQEEIEKQGMDVLTMSYPDPACRQQVRDFINEASGEWRDLKTLVKDGKVIDTTWAVVPLSDGTRVCIGKDITKRKRAEDALRESEERFRQLSEAAFEAIILHDNGTILEVNQSFCRMYGYERVEVVGKSVLDLALPEFRELLLQKVKSGDTSPYESPALRKDGTVFNAEVAGKPINYQGRVVRVAAIRDITEQKRNERRQAVQYAVTRVLAESTTFAEATPQLIRVICESLRWKMGEFWRVCNSTNLLRCVETWHVPGLDATSFIEASRQTEIAPNVGLPGRVWQSRQPSWIPDVTTDPGFERAAIAAKVELRGAVAFPILLGNDTLGVMQFFSRRTAEVDDDLLEVMSAISSQIGQFAERKNAEDARQEAEEKYRAIFENAVDGIFRTTADGRFITANPAMAGMLGYSSPEELIREQSEGDKPNCLDRQRRKEFTRLLDEHGFVSGFEYQGLRKDGSKIWLSDSARAVRDESGTLLYYDGITEDITERKQVGDALRESEDRYHDLVEHSHDMIYTHDLEGRVLFANQATSRLLGLAPNEVLGRRLTEFLVPEVRDQFETYFAEIRKNGIASGLMLVQTGTGERRVCEYANTLRAEGAGGPVVRCIARDVTERKRAEQKIRAQLDELLRLQEVTLGREGRVLELKHEINELRLRLGEPICYASQVGARNTDQP